MVELFRNESITVGTDPIVISEEKDLNTGKRVDFLVLNTSSGGQVVSMSINSQAVSGSGIVMNPGGNKEFVVNGNIYPPQTQITMVSNLAGATVALFERVI